MTKTQMLKRFKELGGKTEKNAIQITREKYVKMMTLRIRKLLFWCRTNSSHWPNGNNCGCCQYFQENHNSICPLNEPRKAPCEVDNCYSLWRQLADAIFNKDTTAYLAACQGIFDKLKGKR